MLILPNSAPRRRHAYHYNNQNKLKALSPYVQLIGSGVYSAELGKLCKIANVGEVSSEEVADIKRMKDELLSSTPAVADDTSTSPGPRFQKALMFFPTGIAFCGMVDAELIQVSSLELLDKQLVDVEKTRSEWPEVIKLLNHGDDDDNDASKPVPGN